MTINVLGRTIKIEDKINEQYRKNGHGDLQELNIKHYTAVMYCCKTDEEIRTALCDAELNNKLYECICMEQKMACGRIL